MESLSLDALAVYGYGGLFLASFLAATILPFSSELVLGVLLAQGFSPYMTVFAATSGNVIGSAVNYGTGRVGRGMVFKKILRLSETEIDTAETRFKRYGVFSLLFAWVPFIGDPLTVAAGMLKIHFGLFLLLVSIGKFLRYIIVAFSVLWI
jgi:membrane protein YqaA with SNARE-associated domain